MEKVTENEWESGDFKKLWEVFEEATGSNKRLREIVVARSSELTKKMTSLYNSLVDQVESGKNTWPQYPVTSCVGALTTQLMREIWEKDERGGSMGQHRLEAMGYTERVERHMLIDIAQRSSSLSLNK